MPTPRRDEGALEVLVRHLKRSPRSIEEIMKLMDVSERSAYRWLKYLEQEGQDVVSRKDSKGTVHFSVL